MTKISKKLPWQKTKKHRDSIRIRGAHIVSFTKGRNSYGARIDGQRIVLKKKRRW